ncbi:hypothetical protein F0562_016063 [Nyssa sinensis]|uniref:Uncharacterized protein n=1 Tax=Nyssa sinensis TaxID=561372 RepID=A0A5J4ZKT8_9ASTE|nr:hypothetical protein F0562_016063 [Nyssa sinensis]
MEEKGVAKPVAVAACTTMAFFYVAILYAPAFILRLPPPASFKSLMIRHVHLRWCFLSRLGHLLWTHSFLMDCIESLGSMAKNQYKFHVPTSVSGNSKYDPATNENKLYYPTTEAHLNHLLELYSQQNCSLLKASMVVRHFVAPLFCPICCNIMGLPVLYSRRKGIISVAFLAGMVAFLLLLFPLTHPDVYNGRTDNCWCWLRDN